MARHVLAYNLTRVMNIMGTGPLLAAIRAWRQPPRKGRHSARHRKQAAPAIIRSSRAAKIGTRARPTHINGNH
jgi:hypothetical protein